jgi:ABC-type antimicrobial peptide transport system permease subunit
MLRNFINIAFRNLYRNPIYSFINIGGLAVGIASTILIFLWVWDELTFDRFHKNADQLGTLMLNDVFADKTVSKGSVPIPLYEVLKTYDPRIKNTCISHFGWKDILTAGEIKIAREGKSASHEFLTMFQFPLLQGSAETALKDPASIVLTETVAHSLFGDREPMGQIVRVGNQVDMKVTGVLKTLPSNSRFNFDFLVPWNIFSSPDWAIQTTNWEDEPVQVLIELNEGANRKDVDASLTKLIRERRGADCRDELFIHPLTDWRLRSSFKDGKQTGGLIDYIKSFSLIGLFILIIACTNFMNLATARSERRAREVGIRKCVGSRRKELITQFLGESVIITGLAFIVALLLVQLALPSFNNLIDKKLFVNYTSPVMWGLSLTFILLVGVAAGSYPAFYLSSFNPVKVLKGNLYVGRNSVAPRRVLVSMQFFFSILLIIGTIVVLMQINFVKARDIGYDRENLVTITAVGDIQKNLPEIEKELKALGIAKSLTESNSPATDIHKHHTLDWPGRSPDEFISFSRVITGYHYTETLGIKILEGRDFSEEFASDSTAVMLNKAAVRVMGIKNPIGMQVQLMPWPRKMMVVGVVDNTVMASPFEDVEPGFFQCIPNWVGEVTVRLAKTDDLAKTMADMESVFRKLNPAYPFEYQFVDQEFARKFASINLIGTLVSVFAFLAIVITCLGIFGLSAFTAEQRTKEIGIRKVMGATTASLVKLFAQDFTRLVVLGFLLAGPVAWWAVTEYLSQYPHRIDFSWWIIPAAGLAALILTVLIVSSQVIKVALGNSVESLRNE